MSASVFNQHGRNIWIFTKLVLNVLLIGRAVFLHGLNVKHLICDTIVININTNGLARVTNWCYPKVLDQLSVNGFCISVLGYTQRGRIRRIGID